MPVNRFGNEDMSTFFQGAQMGNMMALRAQRQQELQSEAALRAVQERHLAAQTEQIAYNLQQAQADKAKEDQDLATADLLHHTLTETTDATPEQATQAVDQWLLTKNPKVALKVGQARMMMAKPELAQEALKTREEIAQTRAGATVQAAQIHADATAKRLGAAGMPMDAAGKFSAQLAGLRKQAADAYDAGDDEAASTAEQGIKDMWTYMDRTHPNVVRNLHAKNLQATASAAYKAYLDSGMKNKKLKAEWERAQEALQTAPTQEEGNGSSATPPAPSAATDQFKKSSGFKIKVIKP